MSLEKILYAVGKHLSDSTAIAAESTPIYALMEVTAAGMSPALSMDARLLGLATIYGGLGTVIGYGRDLSQKWFKIKEKSGKLQQLHDSIFSAGITALLSPPFYLAAGARNAEEIIAGTCAATALASINGIPMGYALDWFRDLTGIQKSERMPQCMNTNSPKVKKIIAAGLVAVSMGATAAVYTVVGDKNKIVGSIDKKDSLYITLKSDLNHALP